MMDAKHDGNGLEPLAIVGLAFEFAQEATSADNFWKMVSEGRNASTEFPSDRFNIDAFYHPDDNRPSTIPLRGGHFIKENIGAFDAPFFSIAPNEAACMDPQHRRMLETAYHALEDAGVPISKCSGSDTSVYTGCFTNDYLSVLQHDYDAESRHGAMGLTYSMMANRVSWFFNMKGTSMNLDSACSSSLLALHLACQDLRARNSSMALVGGANMVYHPYFMKLMSNFSFLGKDSRCWSFDQRANGYARGEGLAFLVVKRLDDALRDNDTIRAVIRNTGSNQDGRTPGITQPSLDAQVDLIHNTYRQASLDMGPTRYFQAHATGTQVGDVVEGNAIGRAFNGHRTAEEPLYIGAVKANLGHTEGCSGLAGVIVTILSLEKGLIPPIASFHTLNEKINTNSQHLHFPTEVIPWPDSPVRRACVNSFGFGGTNAVVILDDAYNYLRLDGKKGNHCTEITPQTHGHPNGYSNGINGANGHTNTVSNHSAKENGHANGDLKLKDSEEILLVLSAPNEKGGERLNAEYGKYLTSRTSSFDYKSLAYALTSRRSLFSWRSFAVLNLEDESASKNELTLSKPVKALSDPKIAFVFTGQGAQYLGMGKELMSHRLFNESIELCETHLKALGCTWSPLAILDGTVESVDINNPSLSQPLTTILQIGLVDLLQARGVAPTLVMGHSSGEVAAAYACGGLSRESAVQVAYFRGLLSSRLASTTKDLTMMAVGLSQVDVTPYLARLEAEDGQLNVEIGCINSPKSVTLTGKTDQLTTLEGWLKADHAFARILRVPMAYHSRFMKSIADEYAESLQGLKNREVSGTAASMISSVSGEFIKPHSLTEPHYWVSNLTSPVEFEAAFSKYLAHAARKVRKQLGQQKAVNLSTVSHVLEIGPHSALQGPIRDILQGYTGTKPTYVSSLVRGNDASTAVLGLLGTLHCAGFAIDLLRANDIEPQSMLMPPADMPFYPFNHSQTYWLESSLGKNFRFRETPRHELLGTRSMDWNPNMAVWRNIIRLNELPWLDDHKLGNNVVVPAAAILAMAIQAHQELFGSKACQGMHIRDASFSHAVSFPPGVEKAETQLTLASKSQNSNMLQWSEFRLFVLESGSYIECSRGFIRAVVDEADRLAVAANGPWKRNGTLNNWKQTIKEACVKSVKDPYGALDQSELNYGPTFQNLSSVSVGAGGEATAQINTESWKLEDQKWEPAPFAIHPSTLDGIVQSSLQSLLAQYPDDLPSLMPVRVAQVWIDCDPDGVKSGLLAATTTSRLQGYRGASADIVATKGDANWPLVYFDGLETAFISGVEQASGSEAEKPLRLCTKLNWKPDIDALAGPDIMEYCIRERPEGAPNAAQIYREQKVAVLCFIEEALAYLEQNPNIKLESHYQYYVDWMKYQQSRFRGEDPESELMQASVQQLMKDTKAREEFNYQVEHAPGDGFFFMKIGYALIDILRGETDPLDLIFNTGLAEQYYKTAIGDEYHAYPASEYADLLSFKNPSMNILEIGAGTGGQTERLIEIMGRGGVNKWARYDYTDISPGFFEHAQEKFQPYLDNMNFRVCDISKDPESQGFETETYDLVVASHVLHATDKLGQTLRNIRKVLKPDGKFLLFETTAPEALSVGFGFGLLKGWWHPLDNESRSPHSPCVDATEWDRLLKEAGFTGVEINIPGQSDPYCQITSILISGAAKPATEPTPESTQVYIVRNERIKTQCRLASVIKEQLEDTFIVSRELPSFKDLAEAEVEESSLVIVLLEVDSFFLDGISKEDYQSFQAAMNKTRNHLWVVKSKASSDLQPKQHLATGFGRALMSEDSARKFVHLELSGADEALDHESDLVCEIALSIAEHAVENIEVNYKVVDGKLQICRLGEYNEMDETVATRKLARQTQELKLSPELPLELHMSPGQLETLQWSQAGDNTNKGILGQNELEVQVHAIGLTLRDHLIAKGQLNATNLGTECAGIVLQAGQESGFQLGERVCLISTSAARTIIRVQAGAVVRIPTNVTFEEAASLVTSQWLAYQALVNSLRVRESDVVLVHQAASSVGQVATQLALKCGARVLATVSSAQKAKFITDELSIPSSDVFQIDDPMIVSNIFQITEGQGVDVIFGPIGERANTSGADLPAALGPCGRIIDTSLSPQAGSGPTLSNTKGLPSNISSSAINMVDLLQERPVLANRIFQDSMKMAFDTNLKPPQPHHLFSGDNYKEAFSHFNAKEEIGKRIIVLDSDTTLTANIETKPAYNFSAEATYVLGGGLGGLGRSIARWMVLRGARHLALLSRSGAKSDAAKALVRELEEKGVHIETPSVDLSDLQKVQDLLQTLSKRMPPVKGCIQCTTALRDNLFPNMTYEDWAIGVNSKATASWNLHLALPSQLDFFVLLASVNGVFGGRAQANYAAANAYQDALAHYRISKGEKAVSIDLGMMVAEGLLAEDESLLDSWRRWGQLMEIKQEDMFSVLDHYCNPRLPLLPQEDGQLLVGVETTTAIRAKGVDIHHSFYRPMFSQLFCMDRVSASESKQGASINYSAEIRQATSNDGAGELITRWFKAKIAQVLDLQATDIDGDRPAHIYGIDSLVGIDLKNWFARQIGAEMQVFTILGNKTLAEVSREAAGLSKFRA